MTERHQDAKIDVKRDIVMFHTVLCIDADRSPVAVAITTNPLVHEHYAQVVMHKTRSHGCATQVARYVRRTFGIEEPVTTYRAPRPVEVMIGWAAAGGMQHAPQRDTPWHLIVEHIAATPIRTLLEECADGHNAARTRYVVYEVRSSSHPAYRGITHRFDALERRYREAPPDIMLMMGGGPEVVQIGRFATMEEARTMLSGSMEAGDHLWTRKPSPNYVRRILALVENSDDIIWTCDETLATRQYDFNAVVIGPHVYTDYQIRHVLEHGSWPPNGNSHEGRRAKFIADNSEYIDALRKL